MATYEPIAPGIRGEQYLASVAAPTFNRWQFDADTFRARQEVEREEITGATGDPSGDSFSKPKTILSGDLKMRYAGGYAMDPPNVGEYAQIKGGDDRWKAGSEYFWVLITASEVTQMINGKVARCTVEMEYRPTIHDAIEAAEISVSDADNAP